MKIFGDVCNFDTGDKMFTGANDTGDNCPRFLLINHRRCRYLRWLIDGNNNTTNNYTAIKLLDENKSAYTLKWTFLKKEFYRCILQANNF
jgi:hypothetical protein